MEKKDLHLENLEIFINKMSIIILTIQQNILHTSPIY